MDQVHVIRHKVLVEGVSIRAVARDLGVSRNTVRKYLEESEPVRKCSIQRGKPVMEAAKEKIEELLTEWVLASTPKRRFLDTSPSLPIESATAPQKGRSSSRRSRSVCRTCSRAARYSSICASSWEAARTRL